MEIDPGQLYGVVSGDVVRSTKLNPHDREQLFFRMKEGAGNLQQWLTKRIMPLEVDIFSGDSWQILLTNPAKTLAAGLFFRAYLRAHAGGCDTRIAAAVGPIDFVPRKKVSEGDGEAFRLSGQLLASGMTKRRMAFAAHSHSAARRWDVAFDLIDAIAAVQWRPNPARAVLGALQGLTQEEIGQQHWDPPIGQVSVNDHLRRAGWPAIERTIAQFEEFWASEEV
jgi:hypothetical protein